MGQSHSQQAAISMLRKSERSTLLLAFEGMRVCGNRNFGPAVTAVTVDFSLKKVGACLLCHSSQAKSSLRAKN